MKRFIISVIVLFTGLNLSSQIDRSKVPSAGPAPKINLEEPKSFQMANGLKVLVVENNKLPRVSVQLLIDNPPVGEGEKAGVASLMGSLLGNGSTSISKDDFNEEIDYLGARISFGPQSASANSLSKYFPRILELMADAASNPNFTQVEFDKEKAKLLTALKGQEKDVSAIHNRLENALAYGADHPYGEFLTEESVGKVSLEDVKKFYIDYFVPTNAYLVVIGDVEFESTQELVTRHFLAWTKSSPLVFNYSDPLNTQYTQINFIDMPNAVQSEISMQNLIELKMKDPDYLAALLANRILGGGALGRLYKNLREDKGFTYGSYSRVGNDKYGPALFSASASVRNAVTDSAVVEIIKEIKAIVKEPVTAEELQNTKAKYVGSFVLALEKPETIARYALNIETEDLPADFYTTYLERLNALTVDDVQKAAQKFFSLDNARIVVTGKGSEVSESLEKIPFNGRNIPIFYYDTFANQVDKPTYSKDLPEGLDVNKVIDAYLEAIGGKEKVMAINSLKLVYEGSAMGTTVKTEEKKANGKYVQTTYMNDNPMMGVLANEEGFYMKQGGNKVVLPPEMERDLAYTMGILPELGIALSESAKLTGIEIIDGRDAYRIDVPGEVVQASYFYDVETGLKVKEITTIEMNGQSQVQETSFKDYQDFEGIKFPARTIGALGTEVLESKLLEATINGEIPDAEFD
ncbi:MAG: pitrilysin family protein [Flavobacteriaceae bacterium]